MNLDIQHQFIEDMWHVSVDGEVDISSATELKAYLMNLTDEKNASILIDGKNMSYIDSTGIGMLIGVVRRLKEEGHDLIFFNLNDTVKKLLEITGLDKIFLVRKES